MKTLTITIVLCFLLSCNGNAQKNTSSKDNNKVTKTDSEWRSELSSMEYHVMREGGTERAFSSPLNDNYSNGTYVCAACDTPLFNSVNKFDSGTGWPSFDRAIEGNVAYGDGSENNFSGVEEHCAVCGGHLGHRFNDGPETTGQRHCINGVALKFVPAE
ncbi:peptide-methionine (R)-S-oxide reductase MsrB [Mangrovimonas aestuarii]|uniref:peptide-methionine (R)-S-oxide reductase MsrB n=1 Tax=Mangrovimonas aestuarii TaxID=3018443 RepID=UPI002378F6FB|nr:peptide-methionine (R)-S-oxide reductase MsrB [Mangrovimonas aestuarii]